MESADKCTRGFIQPSREMFAQTLAFGELRRMASERRIEARRGFRICNFAGGAPEIAVPAIYDGGSLAGNDDIAPSMNESSVVTIRSFFIDEPPRLMTLECKRAFTR